MRHHNIVDNEYYDVNEIHLEENSETLAHRKAVRKLLYDRLERKRLREEFDELDGEFEWDDK